MKHVLIMAAALLLPLISSGEQVSTNESSKVVFHGQELFEVSGISSISAEKRSEVVVRRLRRMARSPLVSTKDFKIHHDDELSVSLIMVQGDVVVAVWEADAEHHGTAREQLAETWRSAVCDIINRYRKDYTAESYAKGAAFAVIATIIFLLICWVIRFFARKELQAVEKRFQGQQMFKFLEGDTLVAINENMVRIIRFVIVAWVFVLYLNTVLSFFPWTFNLSARLFDLVSTPFIRFGRAFVDNLPNLFALLVIGFLVSLILRGFKHAFEQIAEGKVRIKGFYQDWAEPTYRLIRMLIIIFAAVMAFPYIPGSSSPAFKGISIFMGVLLSLGSTSAVGNIFGGLMLTYMRSFMPGDFVEISGKEGTVMSRRTFSTRLKTPTNEIISIPNAAVSSNHIVNYSRMTKSIGVNIGTAVTIGYDVPWRTVHKLLLDSTAGVPDVIDDPAPVVLQLGLDDFYVRYKLVVSTRNPERKFRILTHLHQNIQDRFAEAGVEIMSPHYQSNRSGEHSTVPQTESGRGEV